MRTRQKNEGAVIIEDSRSSGSSKLFYRRLVLGYAGTVALSIVIAIAAFLLLHRVAAKKDLVIYDTAQELIITEKLKAAIAKEISLFRGYVIYRSTVFTDELPTIEKRIQMLFEQLKALPMAREESAILNQISKGQAVYNFQGRDVIAKLNAGAKVEKVMPELISKLRPLRLQLEATLDTFAETKENDLRRAKTESLRSTSESFNLIIIITVVALILAVCLGFILTRTLSSLYNRALKATQLREEILGVVAHDLRNPLTSIQMNAGLLEKVLKSGLGNSKPGDIAKNIDLTATRMNKLVQDLLDFEKIERGHLSLDLKPELISDLLKDVLEMMGPIAQAKGVKLSVDQVNPKAEFICDRDRMSQALSNLIGNALKFTPEGGYVDVGASFDSKFIYIWVNDTGPGIGPQQVNHIFEPHWQARETAKKGNGLGLAIVKGIVDAHNGKISVETAVGKGSKFILTLPRAPLSDTLNQPHHSASAPHITKLQI